MFIIEIKCENQKFYVSDGEYTQYDLSSRFESAKQFPTFFDAKDALNHPEFTEPVNYSNGETFPPRMIWKGLDICYNRPKSSGVIRIKKIELSDAETIHIEGEIKKF